MFVHQAFFKDEELKRNGRVGSNHQTPIKEKWANPSQ
jgi:hypothetical protein